jgi:hypothetical protein
LVKKNEKEKEKEAIIPHNILFRNSSVRMLFSPFGFENKQ